jgi:membrane protein
MMSNQSSVKGQLWPSIRDFAKELYSIWLLERPTQLAAALAYFGLFSFAPVIYIALTITGIFIDQSVVIELIMTKLEATFGPELVATIQELLNNVSRAPTDGAFLISLISFLFLLWGASNVFYQLQFSLNTIWKIQLTDQERKRLIIRHRLFSFLMVLAMGILLVVMAAVSFLTSWLSSVSNLFRFQPSLTGLAFFVIASLSFAVMYRLLPMVKITWRDVWIGATLAAFLITLGGSLVIYFLQNTNLSSALEAAGSFVILLTGFYYFAQIFLLGAILTRLYAYRHGSLHRQSAEPSPADTSDISRIG